MTAARAARTRAILTTVRAYDVAKRWFFGWTKVKCPQAAHRRRRQHAAKALTSAIVDVRFATQKFRRALAVVWRQMAALHTPRCQEHIWDLQSDLLKPRPS
jgi:hypothetical protein